MRRRRGRRMRRGRRRRRGQRTRRWVATGSGGHEHWAARSVDHQGCLCDTPAALAGGGPNGSRNDGHARARVGSRAGKATTKTTTRGGESGLAEVRVGENETFESALRRFNKKIQQSGILAEARRREHYEKPSVKRKRKEAKRKKNARTPQG